MAEDGTFFNRHNVDVQVVHFTSAFYSMTAGTGLAAFPMPQVGIPADVLTVTIHFAAKTER